MKAFLVFALIPLSFALYLYLETKTGFSQKVPWLHFGVAIVGIVLLVMLLRDQFSWWRAVLGGLAVLLTLGFAWWTLSYSRYDDAPAEMAGKSGEGFILVNRQGSEVALGVMLEKFDRTLAIFYRGYW